MNIGTRTSIGCILVDYISSFIPSLNLDSFVWSYFLSIKNNYWSSMNASARQRGGNWWTENINVSVRVHCLGGLYTTNNAIAGPYIWTTGYTWYFMNPYNINDFWRLYCFQPVSSAQVVRQDGRVSSIFLYRSKGRDRISGVFNCKFNPYSGKVLNDFGQSIFVYPRVGDDSTMLIVSVSSARQKDRRGYMYRDFIGVVKETVYFGFYANGMYGDPDDMSKYRPKRLLLIERYEDEDGRTNNINNSSAQGRQRMMSSARWFRYDRVVERGIVLIGQYSNSGISAISRWSGEEYCLYCSMSEYDRGTAISLTVSSAQVVNRLRFRMVHFLGYMLGQGGCTEYISENMVRSNKHRDYLSGDARKVIMSTMLGIIPHILEPDHPLVRFLK